MKKFMKWFSIIFLSCILIVAILSVVFYANLQETMNEIDISTEIKPSEKREESVNFSNVQPFSALLLGVDTMEGDKGRSDTMIVLTVNPRLNTTKMVSIPRDTYTEIIGKGFKDKINHAFAFGGLEMSQKTVEHLLDIPIDYVAQINIDGFKDIVAAVDGVTVNNHLAFSQGGDDFPIGEIELNGEQALNYIQMRKQDPSGDFGRQDRQRQIVQAVLKKAVSFKLITNYKSILQAVSGNVRTNITIQDVIQLQKNYSDSFNTIEQLDLSNGIGKDMKGIYYYIPDKTELDEVIHTLQTHLKD